MDKDLIYVELSKKIPKEQIKIDEPMKKHTSFKVGGNADFFVTAKSILDIQNTLQIVKKYSLPVNILGNGTNILVSDDGLEGIVLKIELEDVKIEEILIEGRKQVKVIVDSGVKLAMLAQSLPKKEIAGFEFASGIPGTIGGAVVMNAGAHGKEMKDCVKQVTFLDIDSNEIKTISNENCNFSYRNSYFSSINCVILNAILIFEYGEKEEILEKMNEYLKYRKEKQPIEYPSAGSTFKRGTDYISAKLIDECGLKGYMIGGAQVSEKHARLHNKQKQCNSKRYFSINRVCKENNLGKDWKKY